MLDQHRLGFAGGIGETADDDPYRPAILVSMGLDRCPSPCRAGYLPPPRAQPLAQALADDPCKHLDAKLGVAPCERPQIGWNSLSGHVLTGVGLPLLLAQALSLPPAR